MAELFLKLTPPNCFWLFTIKCVFNIFKVDSFSFRQLGIYFCISLLKRAVSFLFKLQLLEKVAMQVLPVN